jgi:hypothetical protein
VRDQLGEGMAKADIAARKEASGDVASFLEKVAAMPKPAQGAGRLIFAMDATMSRQPSWDRALAIQSQMFAETARIGGLDVQLAYFRGFNECRASKWVGDPAALAKLMTSVECRGGNTQIGRILSHVKKEAASGRVSAVIYVGDAMEENIDTLCQSAGEVGLLGIPLFLFQEGTDGRTSTAFKEIARLTKGAHVQLDENSAGMLRDLLSAVAVYAAGGRRALSDYAKGKSNAAQALLKQLK